ncbi:hypothetical protein J7L05_01045 [bacterium]|nr:hypothetical protein [bacterium]
MKTEWLRSKWAYGLIGFFFLFIFVNLTVGYFVAADRDRFDSARYIAAFALIILSFIPVVYIVMQLQLMLREYWEKRVRLQCSLPATVREIGYARLLTPFILLVAFTIITAFVLAIHIAFKPDDPAFTLEIFNTEKPWLAFGIIPLTYGFRLFSERIGIIIGSLYLGIMALGSIYIGTGNERDYIIPLFHGFVEYTDNPILFVVATILFCSIIHFSFIARKSYLK